MNLYLVRLRFLSPLHSGHDEAGIGMEAVLPYLHSDTLYSAICNAWSVTAEGESYLEKISENTIPILLSSAFFYKGLYSTSGVDYTYFLPRPMIPFPSQFGPLSKTIKNTEYITLEQFIAWVRGDITNFRSAQSYSIGSKKHDYNDIYAMRIRPRHATDRLTMASSIYHCGEVFFRNKPREGGLYFLALIREADDLKGLLLAMELLQHWGLGGVRSVGYGKFEFTIEGPLPEDSSFGELFIERETNYNCLLSLYYPALTERQKDNFLAYRTVQRKGWFQSQTQEISLKRQSCYMLGEGSILRNKPLGVNLNVAPKAFKDHPVYRCGMALSVPMQSVADEDRERRAVVDRCI